MINIDTKTLKRAGYPIVENGTPERQLSVLDTRLGIGIGARKERERLALAIFDGMSEENRKNNSKLREVLVQRLEIAKLESRAVRYLRKFDLRERTIAEYEEEKFAAQYAA